jgi:hypothetical protein
MIVYNLEHYIVFGRNVLIMVYSFISQLYVFLFIPMLAPVNLADYIRIYLQGRPGNLNDDDRQHWFKLKLPYRLYVFCFIGYMSFVL